MPCLKAWADSLGKISFPLLSDFWPHGEIATRYGVLRDEGYSERAIFVIDGEGIIRYIDVHDIDEQPDNEVLFAELRKLQPELVAAAAAVPATPAEAAPEQTAAQEGKVVLYCTSWCPDCKKAREWLEARGIEYTEVDVTTTPGAAEKVKEWTGGKLVTPTCDIGGTIVIDFDEKRYRELLEKTA